MSARKRKDPWRLARLALRYVLGPVALGFLVATLTGNTMEGLATASVCAWIGPGRQDENRGR